MIRISQLQLPVNHSKAQLSSAIFKKLHVTENQVRLINYEIVKRSLDARNKSKIMYNYIIDVYAENEYEVIKKCRGNKNIVLKEKKEYTLPEQGREKMFHRPFVIGSGPCGLFAAYFLAKYGYKPVLIERGEPVEDRMKSIENFWNGDAPLNPESNIQFGEGGAGTFSDGKLNTGVNDPDGRNRLVLETFIENGAPNDILFTNKPHIGTDMLCRIIRNMCNQIVKNGGDIFFNTKFTNFRTFGGNLYSVTLERDGIEEEVACDNMILALGHSARDTFKMLYKQNLRMEPKSFAVGVRIEHSQEKINQSQYGENYAQLYEDALPPAEYKLTTKTKDGRSVYSFCMCPGGYVVNSSSEKGKLCVNGMSYSQRNGKNANSAIVVSISPSDFAPDGNPMSGIEFQKNLETKAYNAADGLIPIQLYKDFVENKSSRKFGSVEPQSKGYTHFSNINRILPDYVCDSIKEAMETFDKSIKGFADDDAILSAVESRTSSPVRMIRDEHMESNFKGIFPCGEGAGYAGGITSAAIDGIKAFEELFKNYHSFLF